MIAISNVTKRTFEPKTQVVIENPISGGYFGICFGAGGSESLVKAKAPCARKIRAVQSEQNDSFKGDEVVGGLWP